MPLNGKIWEGTKCDEIQVRRPALSLYFYMPRGIGIGTQIGFNPKTGLVRYGLLR